MLVPYCPSILPNFQMEPCRLESICHTLGCSRSQLLDALHGCTWYLNSITSGLTGLLHSWGLAPRLQDHLSIPLSGCLCGCKRMHLPDTSTSASKASSARFPGTLVTQTHRCSHIHFAKTGSTPLQLFVCISALSQVTFTACLHYLTQLYWGNLQLAMLL